MSRLKKIVMIVAQADFRDEEYQAPRGVFQQAGYAVSVASDTAGDCVGKFGLVVRPDVLTAAVNMRDYDAVVFVGGSGCKGFWDDTVCHRIAREAASLGKIVSAICSAPVIVARAGLLAGKKATCFPGDAEALRAGGALYSARAVETDGIFITADGPGAATAFGETIVEALA
jgi:protease I